MREQLYDQIKGMLGDYDGQNKDGVFVTYEGQQYSIKVVAKKTITEFDGSQVAAAKPVASKTLVSGAAELIKKVETSEVNCVDRQAIVDLFGEAVEYV